MILDEPRVIAAHRHRSGKTMIVLNMFKTRSESWPATIFSHSYGNHRSFLHIRVAITEAFVAFHEESYLSVVRFSYRLVTILVRFGHD